MKLYIITIKVNHELEHNPRDKKTGMCPLFCGECTDKTGFHHSFIFWAKDLNEVKKEIIEIRSMRVTRIEEATFMSGKILEKSNN